MIGTGANQVIISNQVPRHRIRKKEVAVLARKVLRQLGYRNTLLSLVFVSDRRIKRLNARFLRHPWATDVLAFPFDPPVSSKRVRPMSRAKRMWPRRTPRRRAPFFLGEVVISPERAKAQAKRFQVPFSEELSRYVCHGVLHLSGFSDRSCRDKHQMRREEDRLLRLVTNEVRRVI